MNKELKDYLHLYLGCECRIGDSPDPHHVLMVNETGLSICTGTNVNGIPIWYKTAHAKLVLRPLSDMTELGLLELARMHRGQLEWEIIEGKPVARTSAGIQERFCFDADIPLIEDIENNIFGQESEGSRYPTNISAAELTRYLLSHHFDLFGLIESGLAIDKTTLNQKP